MTMACLSFVRAGRTMMYAPYMDMPSPPRNEQETASHQATADFELLFDHHHGADHNGSGSNQVHGETSPRQRIARGDPRAFRSADISFDFQIAPRKTWVLLCEKVETFLGGEQSVPFV